MIFTIKTNPVNQPLLNLDTQSAPDIADEAALHAELTAFAEFGAETQVEGWHGEDGLELPVYINEFWTAKQRQANALHEVSYRACFKPQLPRFFIERLTAPGDVVLDPFMGRGTTPLEAALKGRVPFGADVSPLAERLTAPRLDPPSSRDVAQRLEVVKKLCDAKSVSDAPDEDLLVFYHPETLHCLKVLRSYLQGRQEAGVLDSVDAWIRLVATNRLTGHSSGFFSVYTLPPNQAVTADRQRKINAKREQQPPFRDIFYIIQKKSKQLTKALTEVDLAMLDSVQDQARMVTASADALSQHLPAESVSLVVTSPPFLDVVQYATDNWLRCWFNGIDADAVPIWQCRQVDQWTDRMSASLAEMKTLLKPGGWVAFEVGEVRGGKIKLENYAVRAGLAAGLEPVLILINQQDFTKTANCWGVANNSRGTNTNRIVLFRKAASNS